MILIEEVKEGILDFVKTYLDEKRVDNVHEMAGLAYDYVLMHKRSRHKTSNLFDSRGCLGCKFGFSPNPSFKSNQPYKPDHFSDSYKNNNTSSDSENKDFKSSES